MEDFKKQAEELVNEFAKLSNSTMPTSYDVECSLILINREIDLLYFCKDRTENNIFIDNLISDMEKIKDELLKM